MPRKTHESAGAEAAAPTFEELFTRLEERARRLEQGNLSLEESLTLYEEGAALVDQLRQILDQAELRIRTVRGRDDAVAPIAEGEEPYDDDDAIPFED
jgi:exodeoxyribonuclease VII small subunit